MASTSAKASHLERTSAEPRDKSLHTVVLKEINQVNDQIRLFRLEVPKEGRPVAFLPGQWLDVYLPNVAKAGGFTITSTPSQARPSAETGAPGYLELAVQQSPENPPAAWLWQHPSVTLSQQIQVRVGGSFVWPPPEINVQALRRVVFVAGGVGVNPLISMLSSLAERSREGTFETRFLYSIKDPGGSERETSRMLFVERLAGIFASGKVKGNFKLFLTGSGGEEKGAMHCNGAIKVPFLGRRMTMQDLEEAVGSPMDRMFTVVYVCGVPTMTDDFVERLTGNDGLCMEKHRVLCEKWW